MTALLPLTQSTNDIRKRREGLVDVDGLFETVLVFARA